MILSPVILQCYVISGFFAIGDDEYNVKVKLMTVSQHDYDESKIKTLSSLEHIRKRPGMYIDRLGNVAHPDDGIHILLKEVVDNAVDEYIMGAGKRVNIHIGSEGMVTVCNFGRGIPLARLLTASPPSITGPRPIPGPSSSPPVSTAWAPRRPRQSSPIGTGSLPPPFLPSCSSP